tara:strand:- start:1605 stop:1982 length:378 start_codon:yes stop_codon:yes gene_type:complete
MAIPTGSGTEVLYRGGFVDPTTETAFRWDRTNPTSGTNTYTVPTNHIITVLNIIVLNDNSANPRTFNLSMVQASATFKILESQTVPAKGTFIFSDKIILVGGDKLLVTSSDSLDFTYNFIDQDWS